MGQKEAEPEKTPGFSPRLFQMLASHPQWPQQFWSTDEDSTFCEVDTQTITQLIIRNPQYRERRPKLWCFPGSQTLKLRLLMGIFWEIKHSNKLSVQWNRRRQVHLLQNIPEPTRMLACIVHLNEGMQAKSYATLHLHQQLRENMQSGDKENK